MTTARQQLIETIATSLVLDASGKYPTDNAAMIEYAYRVADDVYFVSPVVAVRSMNVIELLDTDTKQTRFRRDVIKHFEAKVFDSRYMAHFLKSHVERDGFAERYGAGSVLAYADFARLDRITGDVVLYAGSYRIETFVPRPILGNDREFVAMSHSVKRSILTWLPIDTPPFDYIDDGHFWFKRPSHLPNTRVANVMEHEYLDGDDDDFDAVYALEESEIVGITKPGNTIMLFSGDPVIGTGLPLASVPQTIDGSTWSKIWSMIENNWQPYHGGERTVLNDTVVIEWFQRPAIDKTQFRTKHPVRFDYALTKPSPPDESKPSSYYNDVFVAALHDSGIYTMTGNIKVVDPRDCFTLWQRGELMGLAPERRGIRFDRNDKRYELVASIPKIDGDGDGDDNRVVAHSIALSAAHDWSYTSDLYVHDATVLAEWLAAGIIESSDLKSVLNLQSGMTDVYLKILDLSDDTESELTDRLFQEFDIIAALIIAIRCGFEVTRISGVGASPFREWVISELVAVVDNRESATIYESATIIFGGDESTMTALRRAKERAYRVELNTPPTDATPTALKLWQALVDKYNAGQAQVERDLTKEIVSIAGYELASRYEFNNHLIRSKYQQLIQRVIVQSLATYPDHMAQWQSFNASQKIHYANAVVNRAVLYNKDSKRPEYGQNQISEESII